MIPYVLILSAPSGAGKTTIARALMAARHDLAFSVSATTRPMREGEANGTDYFFLSPEGFEEKVVAGEFLEYATYSGHSYGTLEAEVDRILESGRHAVLDIEIQGSAMVRERRSDVVSIFILPPSAGSLVTRLGRRNTESPAELASRLRTAVLELGEAPTYDYVVVNVDKVQAVAEVASIIDAEARKPGRLSDLEVQLKQLSSGLVREADRLAAE